MHNHTRNLSGHLDINGYGYGYNYNLTFTKDGMIALKKIDKNTLSPIPMKPKTNIDFATTRMEDISKKIKGLI